MRAHRWIMIAIGVAFAATILLAVVKIRSPLRKFEQIEIGVKPDEVELLMGGSQPTVRLMASTEYPFAMVNHCYRVGMWDIDVYVINGHVTSKEITFRGPWQ